MSTKNTLTTPKQDKPWYKTAGLPAKYVKALRSVQAHIQEKPKSFRMEDWANLTVKKNTCQTVGCICGWMCMLTAPKRQLASVMVKELATNRYYNQHVFNNRHSYDGLEKDVAIMHDGRIPHLTRLIDIYRDDIPATFVPHFERLFYIESWPKKFVTVKEIHEQDIVGDYTYNETLTTPGRAIKRIEHFLQTGE